MSDFEGKAEVFQGVAKNPLIARSEHIDWPVFPTGLFNFLNFSLLTMGRGSCRIGPMQQQSRSEKNLTSARDLLKALAHYGEPHHMRSLFELIITSVSFFVLWAAA